MADLTNKGLDLFHATEPLRLGVDAANYTGFQTDAAGNLTLTKGITLPTLTLTGVATFGGNVVAGTIRRDTADGADNSLLQLTGGGALSSSRGAYAQIFGNEHATQPGNLLLVSGGIAGSHIHFNNGGGEVGRIIGGILAWGTTDTTGGVAKSVLLGNVSLAPSTNPVGGGILYSEAGALKWRGPSGTVTTLALA